MTNHLLTSFCLIFLSIAIILPTWYQKTTVLRHDLPNLNSLPDSIGPLGTSKNLNNQQKIVISVLNADPENLTELNFSNLEILHQNSLNCLKQIYPNLVYFDVKLETIQTDFKIFADQQLDLEKNFNFLESNILPADEQENIFHLAIVLEGESTLPKVGKIAEPKIYKISNWGSLVFSQNLPEIQPKIGQILHESLLQFYNLDSEFSQNINSKTDLEKFHQTVITQTIHQKYQSSVFKLKSLQKMLYGVKNIVINQQVADKFDQSFQLLKNTKIDFESFVNLNLAERYAIEANTDASLLGLLYFPEDQKIGIYVPLFLPCGLSILGTIKVLISYWRVLRIL